MIFICRSCRLSRVYYYQKIVNVIWPGMQDVGYVAVVVHRKWPGTQDIRIEGAPGRVDCFAFWPAVAIVSGRFVELICNLLIP